MKEAIVHQGPRVEIVDSPIPIPGPGQVLIRVVVAGSNPKDIKTTFWLPPSNTGDDVAGYIESVGEGVVEFRRNDRVAAFHEMFTPHGAFAEYAIAWAYTTFLLPESTSFEEAATIPLASLTAALGLYGDLRLPYPRTTPSDEDYPDSGPLVVYGAGTAVGAFAVQFASRGGVHPIICVAGQSKHHVESLLDRSKGDVVIDYRDGLEAVQDGIRKALNGKELLHVFDAVSDHGSDKIVGPLIHPGKGRLTMNLLKQGVKGPKEPGVVFPEGYVATPLEGVADGVDAYWMGVGSIHNGAKHFGYIMSRYISLGLQERWFKPHPHVLIPGGLKGVGVGLTKLLEGRAHGEKYVYRVVDTQS
ncbi:Trans-enoyl reductase fsr4 [Colletotrichum shisoi]|uniref:Trans-enoyl reductase fsr4 n=1 Tax=Colletotrichum shisoi TaxID=2078593 RepID=A0A5Q4C5J0_9PEZI|nr:Trans-enoyl reductase fsr4 [Colletotrichum shisoi]